MIISLTTIPSRIEHLEPTIDSLLKQGYPVYLWLPEFVERLNEGVCEKDIPDNLRKKENLHITIVKDYGSITKLLPAVENKVDDLIITADDDCIYPEGFANSLKEWYEKFNGKKAICYRGKVVTGPVYKYSISISKVKRPTVCDIITGVHGVIYNRKWFDVDEMKKLSKRFPGNDDITISGMLEKTKIQKIVVPYPNESLVQERSAVKRVDSLWWGNNKKGLQNNLALKEMGMTGFLKTIWGRILVFRNPFLKVK